MMRYLLVAASMAAQPFPGGGSNGGTAPVSPSVMATEMGAVDAAGRGTLQLLILWRGTPGWFLRGGGSSSGGSMGGGLNPTLRSQWISQGGVSLTVRFDPAARKVWIQDKEVWLDDANVVLVDAVDSPAGPQVVRTLRIDPDYETTMEAAPYAAPGRGPQMRPKGVPGQTFIRRSPELIEFLQCDTPVPGVQPTEQRAFDMWCAWVRQQ
ncbi:MAG: hypothetical protein ABIS29_01460 [Vicinamibacterales bacterium]